MTAIPFTAGLHQLDDRVWVWLQPDGGWGLSNAGLIQGDDQSLLIDTQFDLSRTRAMLEGMREASAAAPIRYAVNTHGNGDHCYGNELLAAETEIWAAPEATTHMRAETPSFIEGMLAADLEPALNAYLQRSFGQFEFAEITPRLPDHNIHVDCELLFGHRSVRLLRSRPAHTHGDVCVHDPDSGIVFTGDLLFIGSTPIMWAGPARSWMAELDRLLTLDADTFVPGHGPVTDAAGVRNVSDYLEHIDAAAARCYAQGLSARQAAFSVDLGTFGALGNPERIVINMDSAYRHLDPNHPEPNLPALFGAMATWPNPPNER